jgi:hypothetical protein
LAWFVCATVIASTAPPVVRTAYAAEDAAQVRAGHKALVGMGLLGAEIGLVVPALAGLDEPWALIVFPIVGAGAGAVGGHFAFDRPNRRIGAVAMLSLGLALVVPTIVIAKAALAFDRDEDGVEVISQAGPGLLRFTRGHAFFAMPGVDVRFRGSMMAGANALVFDTSAERTEVHLALVSGAF